MLLAVSHEASDLLRTLNNYAVLPIKPYSKLDSPVSSHADMLICVIDKTVFCYEEYFNENPDFFAMIKNEGYSIIKSKQNCEKHYPNDIGLNALIIGNRIFCNKKYTIKEIVEYGESNGYEIINVKQGYSACSTLVVDDNHAVTSDLGMLKSLENEGINVTLVTNDDIVLNGYNCGFIGGSGFVLDNVAYFFGNIFEEVYKDVTDLLNSLNIRIFNLSNEKLFDYGGVKIF